MKGHYDFSKGERGKFYKPGAVFRLPIYLERDVERRLAARAEAQGVEVSDLANELIKAGLSRDSKP
jgi:hypothetical protein